eukprot:gene5808-6094_t
MIAFEWNIIKQDSKWHAHYHQLRRFKEVHGHTLVPWDYHDPEHREWGAVGRWLKRQGQIYAKGLLSEHKQRILRQLGVQLVVSSKLVDRYAKLQGLNGQERKILRKHWKIDRTAESEEWHRAQAQERVRARGIEQVAQSDEDRRQWEPSSTGAQANSEDDSDDWYFGPAEVSSEAI